MDGIRYHRMIQHFTRGMFCLGQSLIQLCNMVM